jgi:hypothetical protein
MPLTKLQSDTLQVLASSRSPDSYVAGGVALNRAGPRYSNDIDIFQDSEARLESAADADELVLREAGFDFQWTRILTGKREAEIGRLEERMRLEWVHDSAFRFFPAQEDELFGYVLHPADLATNKVTAAADRREPRDIVDLLTIHDHILPLGAAVSAAVGRFPGQSPEEMLADIRRHSRFSADELQSLATESPLSAEDLHRRIREILQDAEEFIRQIPSALVGVLFLSAGRPVQPDLKDLARYEVRGGSTSGIWPSSPEIFRNMIEQYKNIGQ